MLNMTSAHIFKEVIPLFKGTVRITTHSGLCLLHTAYRLFGTLTGCSCRGEYQDFTNLPLDVGLYSILDRLIDINNDTYTGKGFISHMEVGTSNTAAGMGQTGTLKYLARKKIAVGTRSLLVIHYQAYFGNNDAVNSQSTVATGTSVTVFDVQAGHGALFRIGDLIELSGGNIGAAVNRTITNIATDTITVDSALPAIPNNSVAVKQLTAECVLWGNSEANISAGTGTAYARGVFPTPYFKPNTEGRVIDWQWTLGA